MDVIASVKSLYEVRIIDVAILCENAHLKHFVFGDTTGPAKVSRVHCRCRPGLPVLVSYLLTKIKHDAVTEGVKLGCIDEASHL